MWRQRWLLYKHLAHFHLKSVLPQQIYILMRICALYGRHSEWEWTETQNSSVTYLTGKSCTIPFPQIHSVSLRFIFSSKFMDINNAEYNNNNNHHHVPLSKNMQIHPRHISICMSDCKYTNTHTHLNTQSHPKQFQFHNINIVDAVVSCHCHNYFFFFFLYAILSFCIWNGTTAISKRTHKFFSLFFPYTEHTHNDLLLL